MINFTIELTKREKLIDEEVEEEEEVPTANVSNEDCGCVCHPGNCTCKADSVAYVKKDFMLDENERACKCLLRRIQKEQELYGTSLSPVQEETKRKPCIDSCVCHCHKNEEKKDFDVADKCIGTCTVHCPNHEHRPSKADDNKPGQKSFAGKPSGDEKESEQIWSNQKYDNEENPNANHAAGPENEKKDGKTTRPSDVRRASTITGGSIFKRLSNSIRRSK